MKKDKLKEYYGTQRPSFAGGPGAGSNFYSGKDLGTHSKGSLGTRGADSNFSRRMQALVPDDYYDLNEEEEEGFDEDVVVENSKYSLSKAVGLVENVLDMEPDEEGIFSFAGDMFDASDLARTERTASYYGLELGFEGVESLAKFISGADTIIDVTSIIFNLTQLYRASSKIFDLDEKLEKEIEKLTFDEILADKEKYSKLFTAGIKQVEDLQSKMYDDFGDLFQSLFSVIPYEQILGGVAASGGPVTAAGAYTVVKAIDAILEAGFGIVIEKAVRSFVESYEIEYDEDSEIDRIVMDEKIFEDWLLRNEDTSSKGMKILLLVLKIMQGPFPAIINPSMYMLRAFRALFVGAKIQNKLLKLLRQIENPELLAPDPKEEFESSISAEETPRSSEFLRKLFVSKPGDTGLFSESMENRSLAYLIEEKDPVLDEDLEEDSEEIEEYSGVGAVAIGTLPLGSSTKGSGKQHSSNSGGKSFPYSGKNRKKFNKYASKTFGGAE